MTERYRSEHIIQSTEQLRALYGEPSQKSLSKELDHVSPAYQRFIEAAPFAVLASIGPAGVDTSPRGDPAGFVRVVDAQTLMLPDRMGNNRADTLLNIVRDGRVSMLFLIPGIGETLRVIGAAEVVVDPQLLAQFVTSAGQGSKTPRSVVVIHVQKVFFQCQKAIARSKLWQAESHVPRDQVPSAGQMLAAVDSEFDGDSYDKNYAQHMAQTIY